MALFYEFPALCEAGDPTLFIPLNKTESLEVMTGNLIDDPQKSRLLKLP